MMRISKYSHKHRKGMMMTTMIMTMMMTTKTMNIIVQLFSKDNAAPSEIHLTCHGEYALLGFTLIPPFRYS